MSAGCETEIANLDVVYPIGADADKYVLGFEVTMNDAQAVDVSKTFEDLTEKSPDLGRVLVETSCDQITQCLRNQSENSQSQ